MRLRNKSSYSYKQETHHKLDFKNLGDCHLAASLHLKHSI